MSTIVSSPAKIHFLGEHAVVYGYPALLTSIDKRVYVEMSEGSSKNKEIQIEGTQNTGLIHTAIRVFKKAYPAESFSPLHIRITSHIPVGSGLGSSAAVASAVLGALMKHVRNIWNPHKVNELTFEVEKLAHGNPSGADNTIVVYGGLLWYRKEFEFLKSIWTLPITQYTIPPLVLLDSGKPKESTKEMVSYVADQHAKNIDVVQDIFIDQERQTKKLLLSLKKGSLSEMNEALHDGEKNLEILGVVGEFAKKIIREIEREKGVAKVCGAGGREKGSGMILCSHPDISLLQHIAKKYEIPLYPIHVGEEGIRIEKEGT